MRGCILVLLVAVVACAGCCCGRVPLFGLWPDLDPAPVEAALLAQPIVVDHACPADWQCDRVETVEAELWPTGYNPLTGQLTVVVAVQATCRGGWGAIPAIEPHLCEGAVAAVFLSAGDAWSLQFVTEDWMGLESSGRPFEPSAGGDVDWD